jgi:release factor glutamine methyltransferase
MKHDLSEQYLKLKYGNDFYNHDFSELKLKHKNEIARLDVEPLHKVLGYIEICGLKLDLKKKVLIPRYETEELINIALENIKPNSIVLDLCSGSGLIGLAIKKVMPTTAIDLVDNDPEAITQSRINAKLNNLEVNIIESNLFNNVDKKYDIIISNPPYVPSSEELDLIVKTYEPFEKAIYAGLDGLDTIKKILKNFKDYLKPKGIIAFEIHPSQGDYFIARGFEIIKDINKKNRFAIFFNN